MAGTIKTSDILIDDNLDALIAKLKQLEAVVESLTGELKKQEAEAAGLEATTKTLNGTTAAGRDELIKAAKQAEQIEKSYKGMAQQLVEAESATQELRQAKKLLTDIAKNQVRANNAEEGSYNQLAAQYNLVKIALNAMSKEQRENTKEGRDMVKQANQIYQEMKRLQAETGKTALNVGNYSEALDKAVQNLGEMRQELRALRDISFEGKTKEEIDAINKRIGELTDNMADLRAEQEAYGAETGALVAGSLQFFAAGIEGIVASTKILGIQSPILDKLQDSVVELIAVSQALGVIEDVLQKKTLQATVARIQSTIVNARDTVAKWANTVATTAAARAEDARAVAMARGSIVTRAAAAVQWLWNAALAANPIGLVVAGVAALVAGIVLLTNALRTNTDEIERQSEAYGKLVEANRLNNALTEHRINLAREQGKAETEVTKMELEAAKERDAATKQEYQSFLKLFYGKKKVTEDEIQRQKDYVESIKENSKEVQILEARLSRQEKDAAEERAKEAERRAKEAKAESERLKKDREARLKEIQDAQLKELEMERDLQLSKIAAETDYTNKTLQYTQERAILKFETEEAGNKSILDLQKQFGRITEQEYKTQLNNLKAARAQFLQEIREQRQEALGETESIAGFDYGKAAEAQALKRVKEISANIAKTSMKALKDESPENIYDLLGITIGDQGKQAVQDSLSFAKQQLTDFLNFRLQVAAQNVAARDREVQAAEAALQNEITLQAAGLANTVETRRKDLADAQARQRDALREQERAQRAQQRLQTIEQAVNLVTAIAKVFSSVPFPLNIAASAVMLGAFVSAKTQATNLARREFSEGDYTVLEGGSHASGRDIFVGQGKDGTPEYAEGGEARMIISKRRTRQYRSLLPEIFQSLKRGTFESEFTRQANAARDLPLVLNVGASSNVSTKGIETGIGRLIEQGQERQYIDSQGRLVVKRKGIETIYVNRRG